MNKKLLPLLTLALMAAGFTSCKKDFDCVCTYTDDDGVKQTESMGTIHGRRPEASLTCQAWETGFSLYAGGGNCKLK